MSGRRCFIDGCRNAATLIVHTHPDDTLLCGDHAWIYREKPAEEKAMDSPCFGGGCDLCPPTQGDDGGAT